MKKEFKKSTEDLILHFGLALVSSHLFSFFLFFSSHPSTISTGNIKFIIMSVAIYQGFLLLFCSLIRNVLFPVLTKVRDFKLIKDTVFDLLLVSVK